ncbi:hexose transporter [Lophiostoma macrostomum CBS 122681]|uniref:Hexose transporter n=1 Tax=Lophiostoma macrostomum CBS 122681 TaxID=1314788 RepID=A0A6A6TDZ8_9PLEO|nr:hexose transporter [Lophiostoma macrostomum CBS 122681]
MSRFASVKDTFRMSLTNAMVISVCVTDAVCIAYNGSLMGSLNVMPSYTDYFDLTTATTAVNTCSTMIGGTLVGPYTSYFSDKYGRKACIYLSCVINIIGAVLSGAAQNIGMFIAGRMIIGIGVAFAQTGAATYVAETTPPRLRSFALGLYYSCWAIGSLLAASIAYGTAALEPSTWAWRIPTVLQSALPIMAMGILLVLPESPRWLAAQDRPEEALRVLSKVNEAPEDDAVVQIQYREIVDTIAFEKTEGRKYALAECVRTPPNRLRFILALSVAPLTMLSGSNIITYYFGSMLNAAGVTAPRTQLQINCILSLWQLVIAITGSALAEKAGRKVLALVSLSGCCIFFFMLSGLTKAYGTSTNTSGIYGTVACMFLFLGAYSIGMTPLTAIYPSEVLSYRMRATGLAWYGIASNLAGVVAAMAFPYMMEALGWKTYIANAGWNILFVAFVYFYWVETKGKTLEEIDILFDGEKHSDVPNLGELDGVKEITVHTKDLDV